MPHNICFVQRGFVPKNLHPSASFQSEKTTYSGKRHSYLSKMAIFHPYLRNPLSDITGSLTNHQMSRCGEFEMRMMECLEAYGIKRGMHHPECKALTADFKECVDKTLSMKRFEAMWVERQKQYYIEGKKDQHYAPPPPLDSY